MYVAAGCSQGTKVQHTRTQFACQPLSTLNKKDRDVNNIDKYIFSTVVLLYDDAADAAVATKM